MQPCLSQVCSLESPFAADVEEYAAGQCRAIEVWLTKLEDYLEQSGPDDLHKLLETHGVTLPVASFQGGLLASQGEARKEAWELLNRRLELCRQVGIETLVVSGDIPAPLSQTLIERVQASLIQLAREAGQRQMRVALEFQSQAAFANNLQTAAALVGEVGSPHLGLCLDAFHFYVGPSKLSDLHYLSVENLFHVQFSDLADVPRELAADSQRVLPGDGDLPLSTIVQRLREIGYERHVSVELMNPQLWRVPPRQFGEIGLTALRKVLGQAQM